MGDFAIEWDQDGERFYQTGVDHGVVYPVSVEESTRGQYTNGYAWNGLSNVTESPEGAESNPIYADNMKYLNLLSAEELKLSIEAYYYPPQFEVCDGTASVMKGVKLGQQTRRKFGFAYRTKLGNDIEGDDYGYEIHLIYGCTASPSEKSHDTTNDSPEATTFSWDIDTIPVSGIKINGVDYKPSASMTISSRDVTSAQLAAIEKVLYGTPASTSEGGETVPAVPGRLPLPAEVYSIMAAAQ